VIDRRYALPVWAALLVSFVVSGDALAQDRGFVAGQVGVTFQSETAAVFGGEFGGNVTPAIAVYGTVGRMQDALPNDVQDVLDILGTDVEASIPTLYAMSGIRAGAPTGAIRPYGVFGAGIAHLGATINYLGRDVTALVEDEIGESLTSNEFAFEIGAGVMVPAGSKGFVDAGYRYMRITGADINVSRLYGGFGVRF
jgi:opacity protein-like surface antigen